MKKRKQKENQTNYTTMKTRITQIATMLFLMIAALSCGNNVQKDEATTENTASATEDKEYSAALKELLSDETVSAMMNNGSEELRENLVMILIQNGLERETAEAETDKFINEVVFDINIKHFMPYCKKHLTIEELGEMKKINAECHELNMMCLEASKKNEGYYENEINKAIMSIAVGDKPAKVERKANYSDRYLALCSEYAETSGATTMINSIMDQLSSMMGSSEEEKEVIKQFGVFIEENFNTMFANIYYGVLSEKDLEELVAYTKVPVVQKYVKAGTEYSKNMEGYAKEVMTKTEKFITEHSK